MRITFKVGKYYVTFICIIISLILYMGSSRSYSNTNLLIDNKSDKAASLKSLLQSGIESAEYNPNYASPALCVSDPSCKPDPVTSYVLPDIAKKYSSSNFTHAVNRVDTFHSIEKRDENIVFSEVLNDKPFNSGNNFYLSFSSDKPETPYVTAVTHEIVDNQDGTYNLG